jgi:O-antigen ligase
LGHFSHNTYLDTFVELGVVGTLTWLGFILSVLVIGVLRCTDARSFPWLQGGLTVMLGSSTFSLLYNPFFSVVAGVLLAAAKLREVQRR